MNQITTDRNHHGAWVLSTVTEGQRVEQTYYGYSLGEAKQLFRDFVMFCDFVNRLEVENEYYLGNQF